MGIDDFMKLNHLIAIEVSIAIGVVVENAITWGVKTSKENVKRECMDNGSSYFYYLEEVKKSYNYENSDFMAVAQNLLRRCLAVKGYSLIQINI